MAKSKIYLSFIILFSFLLSSHVLAYELSETSLENHDDKKVFKERNPTSSYDLERKRRGGSSIPSHFVRHGYKTLSLEETGKNALSKDIAEVDNLGLENRKWKVNIGFGDGDDNRGSNGIGGGRRGSNGGMGSSNGGMGGSNGGMGGSNGGMGGYNGGMGGYNGGMGSSNGQGDLYGGGGGGISGGGGGIYPGINDNWVSDYVYEYYDDFFPGPFNYKDANLMRHQTTKKLSDRGSLHEPQAKKVGIKNDGKTEYGGIPRIEDSVQEKRN